MKLIIVILGIFLILGASAEMPESFSSDELLELEDAEEFGASAEMQESFSSDELLELEDAEEFGILDKLKCRLCQEVMRSIAKKINKHSSIAKIKRALYRACSLIPVKRFRTKCYYAIEKRGDEIAAKIIENIGAGAICKLLQLC